MNKIEIKVSKKTGMVNLETTTIGRDMENLQQELVFKFEDEFVNGSARLEYIANKEKYQIPMTKENESYTIPIKNVITKQGKVTMQLVIVEPTQDEEIPVFKSNVFYMYCNGSINASEEAPDDYEYWLDVIQTELASIDLALDEVDNLDIDVSKSGTVATVTITKKDGTTDSVEIKDGEQGQQGNPGPIGPDGFSPTASVTKSGKVATITITDKTGTTTATVSDGEGGGVSDYTELTNKPSINNVTLSGNQTSSDLGLFSGDYNDLTNKPTVPTKVSDITNDLAYLSFKERVSTSTTSNYFDFRGKGPGIYFVRNYASSDKGMIRIYQPSLSAPTRTTVSAQLLIILQDANELLNIVTEDTPFAYALGFDQDGQIQLSQFYVRSNSNEINISVMSDKYFKTLTTSSQTFEGEKYFYSKVRSPIAPTADDNLANKKYVDDSISTVVGNISTILETLVTVSGGE